jgi:hypothetical protein
MNKLRLDLEELTVDSFQTLPEAETPRGTVQAFASVGDSTCFYAICYNETYAPRCTNGDTCAYSCYNSCTTADATCGNTCDYTCDDATCVTCYQPTDP